jgi:hypothetical protein
MNDPEQTDPSQDEERNVMKGNHCIATPDRAPRLSLQNNQQDASENNVPAGSNVAQDVPRNRADTNPQQKHQNLMKPEHPELNHKIYDPVNVEYHPGSEA